jgi:hypothetical protein
MSAVIQNVKDTEKSQSPTEQQTVSQKQGQAAAASA